MKSLIRYASLLACALAGGITGAAIGTLRDSRESEHLNLYDVSARSNKPSYASCYRDFNGDGVLDIEVTNRRGIKSLFISVNPIKRREGEIISSYARLTQEDLDEGYPLFDLERITDGSGKKLSREQLQDILDKAKYP